MEQRLSPIKLDSYQPLREVVCESLREAIRKGVLKPGERIMEIKLAEELGVSRTPVREAIRKLELEGYVVMMPRRGTYVADMSIRDINEIFEIRTALESLSNSLAAEHITEDELEHLQRLLVIIGGYIKEYEEGDDHEAAMEKIVEAIANGDERGASKAAEHHMENSEKTLLKAMDIAMSRKAAAKGSKKKKAHPSKQDA